MTHFPAYFEWADMEEWAPWKRDVRPTKDDGWIIRDNRGLRWVFKHGAAETLIEMIHSAQQAERWKFYEHSEMLQLHIWLWLEANPIVPTEGKTEHGKLVVIRRGGKVTVSRKATRAKGSSEPK